MFKILVQVLPGELDRQPELTIKPEINDFRLFLFSAGSQICGISEIQVTNSGVNYTRSKFSTISNQQELNEYLATVHSDTEKILKENKKIILE